MTTTHAVVALTDPLAEVAPRRDPLLTVRVVSTVDLDVIFVAGEIDLDTRPLLHRELWNLRGQDAKHLLVDLTAVTFMDAGALGLLIAVQKWVNASHGHLSLRPNTQGVRLIRLAHLSGFFTLEAEGCASASTEAVGAVFDERNGPQATQ